MGRIQTGVDRLVELVSKEHKVSVDSAAKSLGVSKAIIQEWADFLEEEGLLEIKYSFSNTYLIERAMSRHETEAKEKQLTGQRETFIRKVDTTIAQIELETANFEKFKKEFKALQDNMGSDLKAIEKELEQLREYDALKAEVSKDLQKGRAILESKEKEAEDHLEREYKRYHDTIKELSEEEKSIETQRGKVHVLIGTEASAGKKLTEYIKLLETLKKNVDAENEQLGIDEKQLQRLHAKAKGYHGDIAELQKKSLKPLEALHKAHEAKVRELEKKVLAKARLLRSTKGATPKTVQKKMEEFFKRKRDIEELLKNIERDKADLQKELKELHQKAEAYRVGKSNLRFEELEGKLQTVEQRRKGLQGGLKRFLHLLK